MVKIQFDISEDLNKKLKLYSVKNDCENKTQALTKILREYFEK